MGEDLVKQAGEAAGKAAKAFATAVKAALLGLLALSLGIGAAVAAAVAVAGTVVGNILTHLARSLWEAIPRLVAAVPIMAEAVFVGLALLAMLWSGYQVGMAFGMAWWSFAAVIALAPAPLLLVYAPRRTAGTAALSVGVSFALGWVVVQLPVWVLAAILGGLYLWLILHIGEMTRETNKRSDDGHDADVTGVDPDVRVYGLRFRAESDAARAGDGSGDSGIGYVGGSDHVGVCSP